MDPMNRSQFSPSEVDNLLKDLRPTTVLKKGFLKKTCTMEVTIPFTDSDGHDRIKQVFAETTKRGFFVSDKDIQRATKIALYKHISNIDSDFKPGALTVTTHTSLRNAKGNWTANENWKDKAEYGTNAKWANIIHPQTNEEPKGILSTIRSIFSSLFGFKKNPDLKVGSEAFIDEINDCWISEVSEGEESEVSEGEEIDSTELFVPLDKRGQRNHFSSLDNSE